MVATTVRRRIRRPVGAVDRRSSPTAETPRRRRAREVGTQLTPAPRSRAVAHRFVDRRRSRTGPRSASVGERRAAVRSPIGRSLGARAGRGPAAGTRSGSPTARRAKPRAARPRSIRAYAATTARRGVGLGAEVVERRVEQLDGLVVGSARRRSRRRGRRAATAATDDAAVPRPTSTSGHQSRRPGAGRWHRSAWPSHVRADSAPASLAFVWCRNEQRPARSRSAHDHDEEADRASSTGAGAARASRSPVEREHRQERAATASSAERR